MEKKKVILALAINSVITVLELIAVIRSFMEMKLYMFCYYTVLSNLFLLVASILCILDEIKILRGEEEFLSQKVSRIKYMATCTVSVTFLVVVFILTPTTIGENSSLIKNFIHLMVDGSMLYMHFLCPVLAFISYTVLEKPQVYNRKLPRLAIIPTLIYAAVLIILNIARVVVGPYPFLMVMYNPVHMSIIWAFGVIGFAYLIAIMVNVVSKR